MDPANDLTCCRGDAVPETKVNDFVKDNLPVAAVLKLDRNLSTAFVMPESQLVTAQFMTMNQCRFWKVFFSEILRLIKIERLEGRQA